MNDRSRTFAANKVTVSEDENDEYYDEEESDEDDSEREMPQRESLTFNDTVLASIGERFSCVRRRENAVAVTEAEVAANASMRNRSSPSSQPRAAARAQRRRELLLSRQKAAEAGQVRATPLPPESSSSRVMHLQGDDGQLALSKKIMDKMRELREKAKRIEATLCNISPHEIAENDCTGISTQPQETSGTTAGARKGDGGFRKG